MQTEKIYISPFFRCKGNVIETQFAFDFVNMKSFVNKFSDIMHLCLLL